MEAFYATIIREGDDFSSFSCGDEDLDDFIKNEALDYNKKLLAKTYVWRTEEHEPVAFYSVIMDSIRREKITEKEEFEITNIPCYKIARLAVDVDYQNRGMGETMLYDAIYHAKELSKEIGCRLITVDSKPEAVDFYNKYGFEPTEKIEKQKYPTLYLDLKTI